MCIIDNNELLCELKLSHSNNAITSNLIKLLYLLCDNILLSRSFSSFSQDEKFDMRQDAIETLLKNWNKFNIDKSENAFGYFTKIIFRSYFKTIKKENKHKFNTTNLDMDLFISECKNE